MGIERELVSVELIIHLEGLVQVLTGVDLKKAEYVDEGAQ